MRVVQVLTQSTGGPVDHAVDVAVQLAARGHDSHVVGPVTTGTGRARAAGVTWHDLVVDGVADVGGAAGVLRRLTRLRPDVTHLHDRRAGLVGRVWPGDRVGARVYTLHGVPDGLADLVPGNLRAAPRRRRDRSSYLAAERMLAARRPSGVVVPCDALAHYVRAHVGLHPDRVVVVRNGVDPQHFAPPPEAGGRHRLDGLTGLEGLEVVWVGSLVPVKRPELAVATVAALPGVRLRLLGDGPLRADLTRQVAHRGLGGRVDVLGAVPDVRPHLHRADLLLSTSAAESCPLALLQAMACGLPVVATAVGGVPEIVRGGVEGVLVGPSQPVPGLVAALGALARDGRGRRALGGRAAERAREAFGLDACVESLLDVYDRVRGGAAPCVS